MPIPKTVGSKKRVCELLEEGKEPKEPLKKSNKPVRQIINKRWTMGEIIERYPHPSIINHINSYGLHCIGCHVASWETLEQGMLGHGYKAEDVPKIVEELNQILAVEKLR